MKKNAIKSVFSDDLDVLGAMSAREAKTPSLEALRELFKGNDGMTPEVGVDYFTPDEVKQFKEEILAGATPQKFVDYFTDSEIEYIMNYVREGLIDEVTPVKGIHYYDGKPGAPGKDADEAAVVAKVVKEVRTLDEKQDAIDFAPEKIADKINKLENVIDVKVLKGYFDMNSIIKEIKKQKLEMRDIKGMPLNMNDQRWHGGGLSNITGLIQQGTNITITGSGTKDDPYVINSTGSGGGSVDSVVAGTGINVDNIDPANPVVSVDATVFVPYTGATASVDLGSNNLSAGILKATQDLIEFGSGGNVLDITHTASMELFINDPVAATPGARLNFSGFSSEQTFNFPDKTGVVALTSDLSTILTTSDPVDDSNTVFTFTGDVRLVVVNGLTYRDGSTAMGGVISIVGAVVTLPNPVGTSGDIYALS